MVQCCSPCCDTNWFHHECVGFECDDDDADWWCSPKCQNSGQYIYCICGKSTAENQSMVQCHLAKDCTKKEWYHPSCLCVSVESLPGKRNWINLTNQSNILIFRCLVLLWRLWEAFFVWKTCRPCFGVFKVRAVARLEQPCPTRCYSWGWRASSVRALGSRSHVLPQQITSKIRKTGSLLHCRYVWHD